jgi:hypothetical protein
MSNVNDMPKQAGTVLSDGINNFFYLCVVCVDSVRECNCHTV